MKISPDGIRHIVHREGVALHMYRDSAGLPTIGAGHLLTRDELSSGKVWIHGQPAKWADGLTPEQADTLLDQDLDVAEGAVTTSVRVPLSQAQFDTLVSFTFNVGTAAFRHSHLLEGLNAGDYAGIPAQLRRWIWSGGKQDIILVHRRENEVHQWEGLV